MAAIREEMRQIREAAGLPAPREAPPLVMRKGTIGRTDVSYVLLDKWSLQHLAEKHGTVVRLDHRTDIYMEIVDDLGETKRFTAGQYYVAIDGRSPRAYDAEEFEEGVTPVDPEPSPPEEPIAPEAGEEPEEKAGPVRRSSRAR